MIKILALLLVSSTSQAQLVNCLCTHDPKDCEVGEVTCEGQIKQDSTERHIFRETMRYVSGDDNNPEAGMGWRDYSDPPFIPALSFFSATCDGKTAMLSASFHYFDNRPPYPILAKDHVEIPNLLAGQPFQFRLADQEFEVNINCLMTKY